MVGSERPPGDDWDEPEGDGEPREGVRQLFERVVREGVRRVVEKGVGQIADGPENLRQFVQDIKLPKEIAHLLFQQIDETKNGLYRVVARELRDFLDHSNLAEELTRALTTLSFEIKTEIRFIPNDQRMEGDSRRPPRPDVKTSVKVRDQRGRSVPPDSTPPSGS